MGCNLAIVWVGASYIWAIAWVGAIVWAGTEYIAILAALWHRLVEYTLHTVPS